MNMTRTSLMLAGCIGMALVVSCGGSDSNGRINVHLVDGPIYGYQEINVHILSVEISTSGGEWITLGTPNKVINLLNLTGGVAEMLASGASLPAGRYQQMRMRLGTGNTVKLADGSIEPLTVPSGLQTGIKLTVSFEVQKDTTKDIFIDFDAAHSIQMVRSGASGRYILRPTVRAFDKVVTGAVTGVFTDDAGRPLAGAMVYAETQAGSLPTIVRSAVTDSTGRYTLDLLPVGSTYYVVSQPVIDSVAYGAKASSPQTITSSTATFTYNAAFTIETSLGGISGGITPAATAAQSDTVFLIQSIPAGGSSWPFITRSLIAGIVDATETYTFTNVPAGSYSVGGHRNNLASDGSTSTATSALSPAVVAAGTMVTANLTF